MHRFCPLTLTAVAIVTPALVSPTAHARLADTPQQAQAREALVASAAAIKQARALSFKSVMKTEMPGLSLGGSGQVRLIRGATPDKHSFAAIGELTVPGLSEPKVNFAMLEGARVQWIDDARKQLIDRPTSTSAPIPDGQGQAGRSRDVMIMPPLQELEPFDTLLRQFEVDGAMTSMPMEITGQEDVGGVACDVVKVVLKAGDSERRVWIGKADKLPRRYEEARVRQARVARTWEVSDVQVLKDAKPADLEMKAPAGYAVDKQTAPAPAPAAAGQPQRMKQPEVAAPGGPTIGQDAPLLAAQTIDGQPYDTGALKGKPYLISFWGPLFTESVEAMTMGAQAAKAAGIAHVSVIARLPAGTSPADAAKMTTDANASSVVLTGADAALAAFNVRGFPSTALVGADGKVLGFFEGRVTGEQLGAAMVK
jgi:hypothetical protein